MTMDFQAIDQILDKYGYRHTDIIGILQDAQYLILLRSTRHSVLCPGEST